MNLRQRIAIAQRALWNQRRNAWWQHRDAMIEVFGERGSWLCLALFEERIFYWRDEEKKAVAAHPTNSV